MKIQKKTNRRRSRRTKRAGGRMRPIASVLGMVFLVGGLVVVGYMLGDTVLGFIGIDIKPDEPTASVAESDSASAKTSAAEITATSTNTASSDTTTTTTTTTTAPVNVSANAADFHGVFIDEEALESLETLDQALDSCSPGDTVILPLKIRGGALLYASELETAQKCGSVRREMTLDQIADCLHRHEVTAIIRLSMLNDNLYPAYDYNAGYFFADEYTRWLDDKAEEGGKPWLSPFSKEAIAYLQSIVAELNEAGFLHILCEDVCYPDFYSTDLEHIGEKVQDPDLRSEALVNVLNAMQKTAQQNGGSVMTQFSMYAAMNREVEFTSSALLDVPNAMVLIDMHSFRDTLWYGNQSLSFSDKSVTEILQTILPIAEDMTGEAGVIPCLKQSSMSDAELNEAICALAALGYTRYCLK